MQKGLVFSLRDVFYSYKYYFVLLHVAESTLPDEWWRCGVAQPRGCGRVTSLEWWEKYRRETRCPECFPLENNQSEALFHLLCLLFFFLALPELQRFQLMNEAQFRVGGRLGAWSQWLDSFGKGRKSERGRQKKKEAECENLILWGSAQRNWFHQKWPLIHSAVPFHVVCGVWREEEKGGWKWGPCRREGKILHWPAKMSFWFNYVWKSGSSQRLKLQPT